MCLVQLGVRLLVEVEEASKVFRILNVFVISEEEKHLLQLFDHVLRLSLVVVFCLSIKLSRGVFQFVGLGCLLTFRNDFLNSAFSIRAVQFF